MKRPAAAQAASEAAAKRKTGKQPEQEAEQGLETKPNLKAEQADAKERLETKPVLKAEQANAKEGLETNPDPNEMDDENPEEAEPMEEDQAVEEEEIKSNPNEREKERLGTKPNLERTKPCINTRRLGTKPWGLGKAHRHTPWSMPFQEALLGSGLALMSSTPST